MEVKNIKKENKINCPKINEKYNCKKTWKQRGILAFLIGVLIREKGVNAVDPTMIKNANVTGGVLPYETPLQKVSEFVEITSVILAIAIIINLIIRKKKKTKSNKITLIIFGILLIVSIVIIVLNKIIY